MKTKQISNDLPVKIICVSLNFKKLDKNSLHVLKSASFADPQNTIEIFKKKLGIDIDQLSIIQKCNAVMIVAVLNQNISTDYFKNCIFNVWHKLSIGGIVDYLNRFVFYEDEFAVKYIAECALGLNSVTIGDSQVFAQVNTAIKFSNSKQNKNPTMIVLSNWLKQLFEEVSSKTSFFLGNTSLERIAINKLVKLTNQTSKICILGLGSSGNLLTKILAEEHNFDITVVNRNQDKILEIIKKYPKLKSTTLENFSEIEKHDVIILAFDNNFETIQYFKKLNEAVFLKEPKIIIDFSTPSISSEYSSTNFSTHMDIVILSKEANHTIGERSSEINKIHQIIGRRYPFFLENLKSEIGKVHVKKQTNFASSKLSSQTIDIMKTRSKALFSIRNYLADLNFFEISTPYIVGVSTDPPKVDKGGAIEVVWPGGEQAYLRQSNQLYKQMVVVSGMEKIFEIGPFWRAESEKTFRHLEESIGLDVEFSSPKSLKEVLTLAYSVIFKVFEDLKDVSMTSFEVSLVEPKKLPIITYQEAIDLLNRNGFPFKYGVDLGIIGEAKLGEIIQKTHNSQAFAITYYPSNIKKFYTKKSSMFLTETFDIIVGGWELVSGALRETNRTEIEHSMKLSGVNPADYNFYLSIIDNTIEHGGFGLGIDRLIARLLDIDVVSDAVAFPRTFDRLIP